jgi:hypothetical protein
MATTENARGSVWHRWDPHLHGPGTLRIDQFNGADPWEENLQTIGKIRPTLFNRSVRFFLIYKRKLWLVQPNKRLYKFSRLLDGCLRIFFVREFALVRDGVSFTVNREC